MVLGNRLLTVQGADWPAQLTKNLTRESIFTPAVVKFNLMQLNEFYWKLIRHRA